MDACNRVSVLQYRGSKPLGKVRRRIQDVRIPSSSSCYDLMAGRPKLDLSHNESARLAVDCLLSRGLEGYHQVLEEEGEVDFLSKLDKSYILEYGRAGNTGGPGAPDDDDDDDVLSLSASSRTTTRYPEMSTDSDPTVTGLDQGSLKDVKSSNAVLEESSVGVFLSSDSGAAGIKDLVRQFIRKAKLALAIVVDSFTDVELLCDLLEASRKRNVSVHLLLDRHNLSLFLGIWQDVKLESRNFPKLSVRGVCGQNYCAKTGRKLTGQIAESFIIADWTEVLTGSYSFSWLSWQVHRSLAVLIKGSSVAPFLQEFHRLYSSSSPVAGFVSFITLPLTLHSTSHEAQNNSTRISKLKSDLTKAMCLWAWDESAENTQTKAAMPPSCNPQGQEVERGIGDKCPVHNAGPGSATQLGPKPLPQSGAACRVQSIPEEKPIHQVGAASTQTDVRTNEERLEKNPNRSHGRSDPHDQNRLSRVQSQLGGLTITTTDENKASAQEPQPPHTASTTYGQHRTQRYQSAPDVGPERLFFQPSNRNVSTKPPRNTQNTQRGQWSHSLNVKPNVELPSGNFLPPRQAKTNLQFAVTHVRGQSSGPQNKISPLETRRLDQSPLQAHPNINPPGSQSACAGMGSHLRPQFHRDRSLYPSGTGAKMHLQHHHSQQMSPPPGLNWTPQAAGSRFVARQHSFGSTQGTRQLTGGQPGWSPFRSGMITSLGRSKSMTDRHTAGFSPSRT